jgi:hypothetical protein
MVADQKPKCRENASEGQREAADNEIGSGHYEDRQIAVDLQPIWVSRDNPFLLKADTISKGIDTDNWEITGNDVAHLSALFGPFTVDLFATQQKAKCERFYSRSWEEGSAGVDAFAWDWAGESIYAARPVTLVLRLIRKAAASACSGVLIIPLWKNTKF